MAQLMPLPLTVSCFSKIQIGFTILVPAHPRSPGQRAVKWVCVCVCDSDCWICLGLRMSAVLSDNPHTLGWLCPRVPGLYSHSNYVSISACSYCCFHTSGSVPIGVSHTPHTVFLLVCCLLIFPPLVLNICFVLRQKKTFIILFNTILVMSLLDVPSV